MSAIARSPRSLEELESVVEHGFETFVDVGQALLEIRDGRLYRQRQFMTFEDYCKERWGFTDRHARRLIESAKVIELTGPMGPVPTTERQARELAPLLKQPEKLREVWADVVAQHPEPTAREVREVVAQHVEPTNNKALESANANVRRIYTALSSIDGLCHGLDGVRVDRALSVAAPEDLAAWENSVAGAISALNRLRRSRREGT